MGEIPTEMELSSTETDIGIRVVEELTVTLGSTDAATEMELSSTETETEGSTVADAAIDTEIDESLEEVTLIVGVEPLTITVVFMIIL